MEPVDPLPVPTHVRRSGAIGKTYSIWVEAAGVTVYEHRNAFEFMLTAKEQFVIDPPGRTRKEIFVRSTFSSRLTNSVILGGDDFSSTNCAEIVEDKDIEIVTHVAHCAVGHTNIGDSRVERINSPIIRAIHRARAWHALTINGVTARLNLELLTGPHAALWIKP